jgi:bifunctional non-homologous end joining protein LigD
MKDPLPNLPDNLRKKLKKKRQPSWTPPMLATLTEDRFSDKDWIFETKLDGERCLTFRHGKDVRLMSRNQRLLNKSYPELVSALAHQSADAFIVDGEIVAFKGSVSSFSRLQGRMKLSDSEKIKHTHIAVYYYLFDLLYANGYDVTRLPLRDRKAVLRKLIAFKDPLRFSAHKNETGEAFYKEACKKRLEGIIAKRAESEYVHKRSRDWLKFKCSNAQEMVIGGYTEPKGSRVGFGALLVGYYKDDELLYAGMVGTGYDNEMLRELKKKLEEIERDEPSFVDDHLPKKGVHWVSPKLVVQVAFTEWTRNGKLRHPRFQGLRRDKPTKKVVREM